MPDLGVLLAGALGHPLAGDQRVAVAVSGGPDSIALLLPAAAAFPGRVTAITVDHGLRAAAAAEAETVARHCAAAGIPHHILRWTGDKPSAGIQGAARQARYRLIADHCAAAGIAVAMTAHHADDQAETLLMRLARGSGSGGLAGIRQRRDLGQGVTLARPLLGVRRAALAAIAAASGWTLVDDPSNRDPYYARTRARSLLADCDWIDVPGLASAAANLAEAEAALAWTADRAWAGRATRAADAVLLDAAGLPVELVRRLVVRALAALAPNAEPRGADVARLVARLQAGGTATLAGVRVRGGPVWRFTVAPERRLPPK